MDDQDSEIRKRLFPVACVRVRQSIAQPSSQDLHQAMEGAAAAADPPAAGVGNDDRLANIAEQTQLAAEIQLRLVRFGLPFVRGRDNQHIPISSPGLGVKDGV